VFAKAVRAERSDADAHVLSAAETP
jgi:hypothetical protein